MESSVMYLPVHGVNGTMLCVFTVTPCIDLSTLCSKHCSSPVTDTCLTMSSCSSRPDLTPGASCSDHDRLGRSLLIRTCWKPLL